MKGQGTTPRAETLCIVGGGGVIRRGGVKVKEEGGPASEKDIPWLHIPMDNASVMEHPQSAADLPGYVRSLFWRKGPPILQQEGEGVPLDVLLQNQNMAVLLRRLGNSREIGAVHR